MNHKSKLNDDIAETAIRSEYGTKWTNEGKEKTRNTTHSTGLDNSLTQAKQRH
jgi:hypothetical protein